MKKRSLLLFAILPCFLAVSLSSASSAEVSNEQWNPSISSSDGYQGFLLQDPAYRQGFSWLTGYNGSNAHICSSTKSQLCKSLPYFNFNSELKVCADLSQVDCIESFGAIDENQNYYPGQFQNYTWTKHFNDYEADPSHGLPEGGAPSVWIIPGVVNASGNRYLLQVGLQGGGTSGQILASDLTAHLFATSPYSDKSVSDSYLGKTNFDWMRTLRESTNPDGTTRVYGTGPRSLPGVSCASFTENPGECELTVALPLNYKFKLNIKLQREPKGWLHGRLSNPNVSITKTKNFVEVSVQGSAVKVPTIYYGDKFVNLPNELQVLYSKCGTWPTCAQGAMSSQPDADGTGKKISPLTRNLISTPNPWGSNTVRELQQWLPQIKNTASASPTEWSIHTLTQDQLSTANNCFVGGSGVKGIVTTNASAYSEGPPVFTSGSLSYQVAAPHFLNDSSVFKGDYNLIIRADVARCLYKFSSAPISASIQVISNDGINDISTTTFSESSGWDYLSANNFQFSSPTVKITLFQTHKTTGQTCVKGSNVIFSKSEKNKCPTGIKIK
jgi:hypothetical protein